MRAWALIFVLTLASWANTALAAFYSGSKLLDWCESKNAVFYNICNGYLAGLVDAAETIKSWRGTDLGLCEPQEIHSDLLRESFLGYA